MALSIPEIVRQFKADVATALSAKTIEKICRCLRHAWRDRVLDPTTTVHVFLLQVLHGNTACTALSRLAGVTFSAAAYCSAQAFAVGFVPRPPRGCLRHPVCRDSGHRSLAWSPYLVHGWLGFLHVRHTGSADPFWATFRAGCGVQLSRGAPTGAIPFGYRPDPTRAGLADANA